MEEAEIKEINTETPRYPCGEGHAGKERRGESRIVTGMDFWSRWTV